jgi:hypothetical protein
MKNVERSGRGLLKDIYTFRPLYSCGNIRYPFDGRLFGPRIWSRCYGRQRNLPYGESRLDTWVVQPVAYCYTDRAIYY